MFLKNYKRVTVIIIGLMMLLAVSVSFAGVDIIDLSGSSTGSFNINYEVKTDQVLMVLVEKGEEQGIYPFVDGGVYPLNFGEGNYTLSLFESIGANQYKGIAVDSVDVVFDDKSSPYLTSTVLVSLENNPRTLALADELCDELLLDVDKAEVIFQALIKNLNYDYEKAIALEGTYTVDCDDILNREKGICLDFATLYAVMLRSQDIPVKVVMGYKSDIDTYHAWNEVYLPSNGGWVTIDVTYGQGYAAVGQEAPFIMKSNDYQVSRFY